MDFSGKIVFWRIVLLLFVAGFDMFAAENDTEGTLSVGFEKKIARNWSVSASEEVRFNRNMTNYARSETSCGLDYTFCRKYLKAGIGYSFINREKDFSYYENRHRLIAQLQFREQLRKIRLSWRARAQTTFNNENRGDYKVNPKWYLRNRLQIDYKIRNSRFSPYAAFEFFISLNDAEKNRLDRLRSVIGCDYLLTKYSFFGLYVRLDNDVQVKNRQNILGIGLSYTYEF